MSKMGRLNLELQEQLAELGYENIEQAEAEGYRVNYEDEILERLDTTLLDEQDKAHKAWLEEKKAVLHDLMDLREAFNQSEQTEYATIISNTIRFLREGEH